jgi:hypothetical protein
MARIHNEKHPLRTIVPIALFVGASQLAVAQTPKGLNIDVESCVALEKPEERLACFEARVEAARQRPAAPSASDATSTNAGASVGASTAASTAAAAGANPAANTAVVAGAGAAVVAGAGAAAVTGAGAAASNGTGGAERARTTAAEPVGQSTAPAVQSQKSASDPRSVENFGLPEPVPERGRAREPIEIVATVTELRQTVPNAYVITLDNGQVWRQAHPMPYPLHTGLVVRVRETQFGYRLTAPELHGQINVERVR